MVQKGPIGPKKGSQLVKYQMVDHFGPSKKNKNVNHVIVKISTLNFLLCFLIIVPMEFRVGRRCVRYGVGQEHGQQIL